MESAFEKSAKRAAVEAVEQRVDRNEATRRKARRMRRARKWLAFISGGCILAFLCLYLSHGNGLFARLASFDASQLGARLSGIVELCSFWKGSSREADLQDPAGGMRERYAAELARFRQGEIKLWREASDAVKPRHAAVGTVYGILLSGKGGFDLYRLTVVKEGLRHERLSPFSKPVAVEPRAFRRALTGRTYLVTCGRDVYVAGGTLAEGQSIRRRLNDL